MTIEILDSRSLAWPFLSDNSVNSGLSVSNPSDEPSKWLLSHITAASGLFSLYSYPFGTTFVLNFPGSSWQKIIAVKAERKITDNRSLRFCALPFTWWLLLMFMVMIKYDGFSGVFRRPCRVDSFMFLTISSAFSPSSICCIRLSNTPSYIVGFSISLDIFLQSQFSN